MRLSTSAMVCAALLLAGCGSTTIRHVTTTITRSASATSATSATSVSTSTTGSTTTAAGSAPSRSAVAGRSPAAIVQASADALRRAHGYVLRADLLEDHQRSTIDISAAGPQTFSASLATGKSAFQVIAIRRRAFLRGNRVFWRAHAGSGAAARVRAARLAGRWLRIPASEHASVIGSLGSIGPATLARCLTEDHGTLSLAGHATVGGRRAVIVRDAGNAPGATPSTIAVATGPTPYPLRYTATGATRPGGRIDVCNDGKGDGARGTITLGRFGSVATVHAPSKPLASGPGAPVSARRLSARSSRA